MPRAKPAPETNKPARLPRNRERPIKVYVTDAQREEITARANASGMSLSAYLCAAGMNHTVRSVIDNQIAIRLIKVAGDLGRFGGLLKLWLSERRGEGATAIEVNKAFTEARTLQQQLGQMVATVLRN